MLIKLMKIIFSTESIKYPLTGIGRYAWELATRLRDSPRIDSIRYFHGTRFISNLPEIIPGQDNKSSRHRPLVAWARSNPLAIEAWRFLHPRRQARALRNAEDAVYHGPNFYLPHNIGRSVATFHDISIFTCPWFHPKDRVRFMEKSLRESLNTASLLLTVSDFSRDEIIKTCGYPGDRIIVTPLACNQDYYPRSEAECLPVLTKYQLRWQRFGLYIGTMEPRKNIKGILQAYERLPAELRKQYPMIFSGYRGWEDTEVWQLVDRGTREGWIHYLGYVPEQDLPFLYSAAATFIYPSHYEGFGLPVLEAMSCGTPVVTSSTTSLPEVAGDAALMTDPQDIVMLSQLIQRSFVDTEWRTEATRAGLSRSRNFSWQRCTEQTIDAYQLI